MDNGKKKREIVVPIICLLLSIGLWFYITNIENPIKTIEINKVPVNLVNEKYLKDAGLALVPNQEFNVNLKIEGLGNQTYNLTSNNFKVEVDLSEYAFKKGENRIPVNLIEAPKEVNVKNDNTLTININLEELQSKSVNIKSDVKVNVKEGFFASQAVITPEQVEVSGPKSLVDTVSNVVAVGEEKDVMKDIDSEYQLKAVNSNGKEVKGVSLSQEKAEVSIKISKGKSVPLKIATVGELPSGLSLKGLQQTRNTVELVGPEDVLKNITEVYSTQLDLSTITDNQKLSLKVVVPEGVSIIPGEEYVDVTINVIKYVKKEFEIPISITGEQEKFVVTPDKMNIKVTLSATEEIMNSITVDKIKASIDVHSYSTPGNYEITPDVSVHDNIVVKVENVEKVLLKISEKIEDKPTDGEVTNN